MRVVITSALLLAALATAAHVRARPPQPGAEGTFTVMTFNIQHGIDGTHKYNLQRAIDTIAKIQPDLVGVQEVTRNHPYYDCDDQPARIADGLKAATGRTWSAAYEQEWFTPNVECKESGRGDGKETEGLAFFAPVTRIGSTHVTPLPVSRIAFAVVPAGGVPVVVTHLASGQNNGAVREKEVGALLPWARKLGSPHVIIGDFNATADSPELQPVVTAYRDAWKVGSDAGVAAGEAGTHGEKRIDFVFFQPDGLELTKIETIDTRTLFGAAASDHRPVVATFRVTGHPSKSAVLR